MVSHFTHYGSADADVTINQNLAARSPKIMILLTEEADFFWGGGRKGTGPPGQPKTTPGRRTRRAPSLERRDSSCYRSTGSRTGEVLPGDRATGISPAIRLRQRVVRTCARLPRKSYQLCNHRSPQSKFNMVASRKQPLAAASNQLIRARRATARQSQWICARSVMRSPAPRRDHALDHRTRYRGRSSCLAEPFCFHSSHRIHAFPLALFSLTCAVARVAQPADDDDLLLRDRTAARGGVSSGPRSGHLLRPLLGCNPSV